MKSFLRFLMKMQEFSNYYFFIISNFLFQSPAKNSREKKKYDAKIQNKIYFFKDSYEP